jgi:preprotein translocase subunit SecG
MSNIRLTARSVSDIVDASFQLYRRDAMQYILVSAVGYAPWLIFQLIFIGPSAMVNPTRFEATGRVLSIVASWTGLSSSQATSVQMSEIAIPWRTFMISSIGSWLTLSLMTALLVKMSSEAYMGRQPDPATALRDVLPRLGAVLLASFFKGLLLFAGFIVFIVGAFYVAARYFAITEVIVLERAGIGAAFSRSSTLSAGRKGHILKTLALVAVIFFVLSLAVGMIASIGGSDVVRIVASTAYTIVVWPIFAITEMVLYYDARIRGEGYDIEMMANALEPASAERAAP